MNRCYFFLSFAIFAVLSCSDEKSPSREEICARTPVEKDCLVGNWNFMGVYLNDKVTPSSDCSKHGDDVLELKADNDYHFIGGQHEFNIIGKWSLEGNYITAKTMEILDGKCDDDNFCSKTGTVLITDSGNEMWINATDSHSVFANCDVHKSEKFIRQKSE